MGRAVRLANQVLQVDVLPDNGGRIASMQCLRTGTEFLLSGSRYEAVAAYSHDAPFEASDCAGWDECLPTVSLSSSDSGEEDAPDHGDLWRRPWNILEQSDAHLVLSTACSSRPITVTRSLRLTATTIHLDYTLSNTGGKPETFLYACHPLFAVDAGDVVLLPSDVDRVLLHFSQGDRLGVRGRQLPWPLATPGEKASAIHAAGSLSDGSAEMFYVTSLRKGSCALYRSRQQQALLMRFSLESLPYLGLWICNGGWPEREGLRKQHAIALEPTVAPFGSLADAVAAHAAPVLQPGADFSFSIEVTILGGDQPVSREEVSALLET